MEGGSANDLDYCSGDPVNCNDLDGTRRRPLTREEQIKVDKLTAECRSGDRYLSPSAFCRRFLRGVAKGDVTAYGFGFVPDKREYVHCPSRLVTASRVLGYGDYARAFRKVGEGDIESALNLASAATASNDLQVQVARRAKGRAGKIIPYVGGVATATDAACTNI